MTRSRSFFAAEPSARQRAIFDRKVVKIPFHECWEWAGFHDRAGYGKVSSPQGQLAHRFSWWLHRGPIPVGGCILHECDNRGCVNPDHLKLGDQKQNAIDRESRGRGVGATGYRFRYIDGKRVGFKP